MLPAKDCCIWNGGSGAWAFAPLAGQLAAAIGIEISGEPRRFNYLLQTDREIDESRQNFFIPPASIRLAADKRLLAEAFQQHHVPMPETHLFKSFADVVHFVNTHSESEWCLKYPTGCGASGHRLLTGESEEPSNWPQPFLVQEFIRLENPEVYRTYGAGGELFGWVVRRYPQGIKPSPWVAHARGARYVCFEAPPHGAAQAAEAALRATNLLSSFGCVDLLRRPSGEWLVLEVGTDGLFNHVDRELDHPTMELEIEQRIAKAFWKNSRGPL